MSETLLENVRSTLLADATLAGLLVRRIYPDAAPEGNAAAFPYIAYFEVSLDTEKNLAGTNGLRECRLQFDIYATTKAEARTIRERILALFDGYHGTPVTDGVEILYAGISNHRSDYDPAERVYNYALDINFHYRI